MIVCCSIRCILAANRYYPKLLYMSKKKNAFVVLAIDGISTIYSGVGTIVYSFFEAYDEIKSAFGEDGFDLFAFTPYFNLNDSRYSSRVLNDVTEICRHNGGDVIYLPTMCHGEAHTNSWRGNDHVSIKNQWESASISAASSLNLLARIGGYDSIFVLCHDTLFANVSKFVLNTNIHLCWVPHSLSSIFDDHIQSDKLQYEKESISTLLKNGHKIAYLSQLTKNALTNVFFCKEEQLVSLYSGIYLRSGKFSIPTDRTSVLNKYNIPLDRPLVFSWARCAYAKGIDTILKAFISCKRNNLLNNVHLVLLCPDSTAISSYTEEVNELIGQLAPEDYTFITRFDEQLPLVVLKHAMTKCVILASRFETFGLSSLEALAFRHPDIFILYSSIPTFEEALNGKSKTKSFSPGEYLELADDLNTNLMYNENPLAGESSSSKSVLPDERFDLVKNYSYGLSNFVHQFMETTQI